MFRAILSAVLMVVLGEPRLLAAEATQPIPLDRFDDPDAKSAATGTANRVVLEAGDADAKATLRLANKFQSAAKDRYSRYALTITAPFDSKKADKVDVGTLSGLTAGTSASLELALLKWPLPDYDDAKALRPLCEKAIPRLIPGYDWDTVGPLTGLFCNEDLLDPKKLEQAVEAINAARKKCPQCNPPEGTPPPTCKLLSEGHAKACSGLSPASKSEHDAQTQALCTLLEAERREACAGCEGGDPAQRAICSLVAGKPAAAVSKDAARVIAEIRAGITERVTAAESPMYGITLGAKANHQKFSYVLPTAPTVVESSNETGYGLSLSLTRVGHRHLFTLGYSHEESYKAGSKVQVCNPIGTTGSLSCSEATLGAPKKKPAELIFLEDRLIVRAGKLALAARVEYDLEDSQWAARLPIYFIANKSHQLTAGVALGYTEADDEGFGAAIFVSKAFSFFD